MSNPFKVLGVHRASSKDEVRDAYMALAKELHPDSGSALVRADPGRATERFLGATTAYKLITTRQLLSSWIKHCTTFEQPCKACRSTGVVFKQIARISRQAAACGRCHGSGFILREDKHGT